VEAPLALFVIVFLLGLGAGWLVNRWRPFTRRPKPESIETTAPEQPAPAVVEARPPAPQDLAGRLQPLRATIDSVGRSSSHPRDLLERAEFEQAVSLLSDPSVPLASVIDYACGANWAIVCTAYRALTQRAEGCT
jgi:hypothetical protein